MISLYFHIPFCKKKCNYCDFYSITDEKQINKFIAALKKEIILRKNETHGKEIDTIFFGGGSPSVLTESQFCEISDFIKQNFKIAVNYEWTIEVNPENYSEEKAKIWQECGVNRLSIGIQSLNDDELNICGRIHDRKQAIGVLRSKILKRFDNVNADLIYGLPNQNKNSFSETLKTVCKIPVIKHISLYELTIAENSFFGKNREKFNLPNESEIEKIVKYSRNFLQKSGFERYEVSNFAKNGCRCRHNENYWNYGRYIGFGPSSHSFDGENKRSANISDIEKYCELLNRNEIAADFIENLLLEQKKTEFLMLKLRTSDGFSLSEFGVKFGIDFLVKNKKYVNNLIENDYMIIKNGVCKLTDKGLDIADGIAIKL
ncbi:MAG: radical SAM family heme chaperone HemW [Chitinispirillales bacterium]|jgi:oxygen-independent coproporphyrinogen-3 oxidase|nr:radical SAM family heme chaperone HemW [Chitinispirillales bacterium]